MKTSKTCSLGLLQNLLFEKLGISYLYHYLRTFQSKMKRIFIIDGIIESIEPVNFINPEFQDIKIIDYGDHLISAGFVDAHVHYPQTAIIASWGKRLIDWLNVYTLVDYPPPPPST